MTKLAALLMGVLVASGMFLVHTSYQARALFNTLEKAKAEQLQLDADGQRLEAERQAQATHLRIEKVAREKLGMRLAGADALVYVNDSAAPGPAASGGRR